MLIDLSMPVNPKTVVFPGDAPPRFAPTGTCAEYDVTDTMAEINVHLGTHIDAPLHMLKDGKRLSDYPVDRFRLDALCIDARHHERLGIDLLDGVKLTPGMAVLFCTGAGDRFTQVSYATEYPTIDPRLADALVEQGVSMVGVDMISFDHDAPFPVHKVLLGHDILLIENLINLGKVAGKCFKLYAWPVHFELEGAPARVVAEVA